MQWIKYSERKPTEPGYYICKHYYKEVPEIIAGVDYMEFKDGGFWSEDEIYKLMWLDESSPPCQCERYRDTLFWIYDNYALILNVDKWANEGIERIEAILADGGKEDVTDKNK